MADSALRWDYGKAEEVRLTAADQAARIEMTL